MNFINLMANFLICLGAILMALNIKKFREVIQLLKIIAQQQYDALKPILLFHHFLIVSFFIGYTIVLIAINSTDALVGNLFVSIIFFSGAVFVFLGIILQKRMIKSLEITYEKTLIASRKLSSNQKELMQANQALKQEIELHKETSRTLKQSFDTQTIVNKILKASLKDSTLNDVLNLCLDLVISLPWLSFESQGCIYLVEEKTDVLVLKASRGFSDEQKKACAAIPFGKCLCGIAALNQETVFASNIDTRHDILLPDTPDHGHYCIPILAKGETIGIINIHVKPGHQRNPWEEDFLNAVANTITIVLMQYASEERNKEMELRLNQSQKMESIGTLAGGIAHDFNNILSGIFGYTQLAERHIDHPEKVKGNLHQINQGAKRATDLIQQILTFSRQAEYQKRPVKLYLIVNEAIKFLRSSMPSTIKISENIASRAYVKADPIQIQQIVMNLCTNAFHAMRETGGDLSVRLSETVVDNQSDGFASDMASGTYLKIEVKDTGHGIAPENLNKIFEPYFTTKKIKEGTGLGLAVVHGIVRDHKGQIAVTSTPGQGTVFQIYFPKFEGNTESDPIEKEAMEIVGGRESILIVDDEESILNSMSELLADYGYTVKSFLDVNLAFKEYEKRPDTFDLIITDMTMPGMTGETFSSKILNIRKDALIIICTGYSDRFSREKALKMGIKKYLQKPIESNRLLLLIRKILDENK